MGQDQPFVRKVDIGAGNVVKVLDNGAKKLFKRRKKKMLRQPKRHEVTSSVEEVCNLDGQSKACEMLTEANSEVKRAKRLKKHKSVRSDSDDRVNEEEDDEGEYVYYYYDGEGNLLDKSALDEDAVIVDAAEPVKKEHSYYPYTEYLTRKKLGNELYQPAFSSKAVFCDSKFRQTAKAMGPKFKIIDGSEADVHAFPWVASLKFNGEHFCGGSLINKQAVITAAHCMDFGPIPDLLSRIQVRSFAHF